MIPRGSAGLKKEKPPLSILFLKISDGEDYTEPTVITAAGELYAIVTDFPYVIPIRMKKMCKKEPFLFQQHLEAFFF